MWVKQLRIKWKEIKQTAYNEKGESLHCGNFQPHLIFCVKHQRWKRIFHPSLTIMFLLSGGGSAMPLRKHWFSSSFFTHQLMTIHADQNLHRLISGERPLIRNPWGSTAKLEVSFSKHRVCIQFLVNRWQFFINTTWRSASCRCFLFSCLYLPSK